MKIKFNDFMESNESGRFLFNPYWLEYLLNLFYQGYLGEFWCEVQDTLMNYKDTVENVAYGIIGTNLNSQN